MKVKLLIVFLALGLLIGAFWWIKPFYIVPILNYHSVNIIPRGDTPSLTPENFIRQLEFIRRGGYKVISLAEYVEGRRTGKKFKNEIVITFDDGYDDNYQYAYPILKQYGFPATIFLIVNRLGKPGFLRIEEVREMAKDNITFGSHTANHPYLPDVKDEKVLREEIFGSKRILEQKLGKRIDYFCYPFGGFSERVENLVRDAGYLAAFTTKRGRGKFNQDLYALKRRKVTDNKSALIIWLKLSGYYQLFQADKPSH